MGISLFPFDLGDDCWQMGGGSRRFRSGESLVDDEGTQRSAPIPACNRPLWLSFTIDNPIEPKRDEADLDRIRIIRVPNWTDSSSSRSPAPSRTSPGPRRLWGRASEIRGGLVAFGRGQVPRIARPSPLVTAGESVIEASSAPTEAARMRRDERARSSGAHRDSVWCSKAMAEQVDWKAPPAARSTEAQAHAENAMPLHRTAWSTT